MWEPSQRYPDPAVQVLDASFNKYRLPLASVERLATGCRWSEGPVYFGDGRYVLWSDIPNDRILKWEEETGAVSVFRKSSNNANGNTRDRQGRLVTCEHRGRRVIRTEYDGAITVLADSYQGKKLNSPNDVVVKSDGSDLVHRSAVRPARLLRGREAGAGTAGQRLSRRWADRRGHRGGRRCGGPERAGFLARRIRNSTWSSRAPCRRASCACSR